MLRQLRCALTVNKPWNDGAVLKHTCDTRGMRHVVAADDRQEDAQRQPCVAATLRDGLQTVTESSKCVSTPLSCNSA